MSLNDREWFHRKDTKPARRSPWQAKASESPPGLGTAVLIALALVAGVLIWRFA